MHVLITVFTSEKKKNSAQIFIVEIRNYFSEVEIHAKKRLINTIFHINVVQGTSAMIV